MTWFIVFAKHTAEILQKGRKALSNQSINQPNKRNTSMTWSTNTKLIDWGIYLSNIKWVCKWYQLSNLCIGNQLQNDAIFNNDGPPRTIQLKKKNGVLTYVLTFQKHWHKKQTFRRINNAKKGSVVGDISTAVRWSLHTDRKLRAWRAVFCIYNVLLKLV